MASHDPLCHLLLVYGGVWSDGSAVDLLEGLVLSCNASLLFSHSVLEFLLELRDLIFLLREFQLQGVTAPLYKHKIQILSKYLKCKNLKIQHKK